MFEGSNLFVFFPAIKVAFSVASLLIQIDCLDKLIWPQAIKAPQSISKPFALISNIFLVDHAIILILGSASFSQTCKYKSEGSFFVNTSCQCSKISPIWGFQLFKTLCCSRNVFAFKLPLFGRIFLMSRQFCSLMQQLQADIKCKSQKHIFIQQNCNIFQLQTFSNEEGYFCKRVDTIQKQKKHS